MTLGPGSTTKRAASSFVSAQNGAVKDEPFIEGEDHEQQPYEDKELREARMLAASAREHEAFENDIEIDQDYGGDAMER